MLSALRTSIKFFTIGLLAGLLLAPRRGEETRRLMMERSKELVNDIMSVSEGQAPA